MGKYGKLVVKLKAGVSRSYSIDYEDFWIDYDKGFLGINEAFTLTFHGINKLESIHFYFD